MMAVFITFHFERYFFDICDAKDARDDAAVRLIRAVRYAIFSGARLYDALMLVICPAQEMSSDNHLII